MHYDLTTLPNGLRIITETMPGIRSVAIGAWVDTGTRDELPNEAGASHFLEHLLFKGSAKLSSREISERFDSMGAEANAFTSKDHTCFWARLLDTDLADGVEILAEMLQRPAFRKKEIDSERQVVVEEINEAEDDPADRAFERFTGLVFSGHPLERPILGTRESLRAMKPKDISGYWSRRYGARSTVIALAGSIEHELAVKLVGDLFGDWDGRPADHEHGPISGEARATALAKPIEQAHLVVGGVGFQRTDPRKWPFEVLNVALGGGMSSRLFTTIREEKGLAYSVSSFRIAFADAGAWGVYAATTPGNARQVIGLIEREIQNVVKKGITRDELDRAKGSMRGSLALAMEDANSRMVRLGRDEMVGAPHLSIDERIARIDAVTGDEVVSVAGEILTAPRVISVVGPFPEGSAEEWL
jgi:predicted Zn-dependent peptidase